MERAKHIKPFTRKLTGINFDTEEVTFQEATILANDPSFTAWGWVVVNKQGKIIASGCLKTAPESKKRRIRKSDDTTRRASEIIQQLLRIIKRYNVCYLLSESPHGSQNASAAVMIGLVAGIVQTLADTLNLGIEWYSEQDAKKAVLGKKAATKSDMIEAIDRLYEVDWTGTKYIDEAVADALAVYSVARLQSPTLKMMGR